MTVELPHARTVLNPATNLRTILRGDGTPIGTPRAVPPPQAPLLMPGYPVDDDRAWFARQMAAVQSRAAAHPPRRVPKTPTTPRATPEREPEGEPPTPDQLKARREALGLSQRDVAGYAGGPARGTVANAESPRATPVERWRLHQALLRLEARPQPIKPLPPPPAERAPLPPTPRVRLRVWIARWPADAVFTTALAAAALADAPPAHQRTLRDTLVKLVAAGELERVGKGVYRRAAEAGRKGNGDEPGAHRRSAARPALPGPGACGTLAAAGGRRTP